MFLLGTWLSDCTRRPSRSAAAGPSHTQPHHQPPLNNLRLAISPPILYLVTTKSSAMVCSCCSSSDIFATDTAANPNPMSGAARPARAPSRSPPQRFVLLAPPRPRPDPAHCAVRHQRQPHLPPKYKLRKSPMLMKSINLDFHSGYVYMFIYYILILYIWYQ